MRINKQEHKKIMLKILSDISTEPTLAINIGFKGGTACYFLYGLDRFSVDLDFDLLNKNKQKEVLEKIDIILSKYGKIKMEGAIFSRKVKYDNENNSFLKVDISDRLKENSLNKYEIQDITSSYPLKILSKMDIFAHKLIAIKERYDLKEKKKIANRDLYDLEFFFRNNWRFNEKIIKLRSGQNTIEYLQTLRSFIEKKVDNSKILDGLGSLVDDKKRIWVKNNLKKEVLKYLAIEIDSRKN